MNTSVQTMTDHNTYSDKGPRHENQDSVEVKVFDNMLVACIADGVSGKECGKKASSLTIRFFLDHFSKGADMTELVKESHAFIKRLQDEHKECSGMATTFTACYVENRILKGVHVGDSRICILRGNGIKQLTQDHTEVNRLLQSGKITFEDSHNYPRRNILESAVGIHKELLVQSFEFELRAGDRVLLTTDGVHNVISKKELRDLSVMSPDSDQFSKAIIKTLSYKKLSDNVSFIVLGIN
ncbi:MAG TPA: protein phosphatase 2C domain-containing protein [Cyclobacteriaceae bacterium]|nr:protein phosphatase 2C domain-containing protein [Cyclobacteriaceae bacterium]HRJ81208.1 protein phosphatase 2C domain-containing protein [Cyclobacteriaceae bacterium]